MKFAVVSVLHFSKITFLFKCICIPDLCGGRDVGVLYIEITMYILRWWQEFQCNETKIVK